MNHVNTLLRHNMSASRLAVFLICCFLGLSIVMGALQFWNDARSLLADSDSFLKSDFLVLNKKVTAAGLWGDGDTSFTEGELADLQAQPWVRNTGLFTPADYRVWASVEQAGRGMSSMMFFESVPDSFVDVPADRWRWLEGDSDVPVIIPKDYLTLYNFGFAGSAGLPQLSESMLAGIPLRLTLSSDDGSRTERLSAHIAGYSNRLNTILVPEGFMKWSNSRLGRGTGATPPSRIIVDVSSPGDTAIGRYLDARGLETAGDKSSSQSVFLLRLVAVTAGAVGAVITLLSFFILLLSVSLLLEKNRSTLHRLLFLGFPVKRIAAPYEQLVAALSLGAWLLATGAVLLLRRFYAGALTALGSAPGPWWTVPAAGLGLTALLCLANVVSVRRRVRKAWRSHTP